jgi:hypothetical protein
MKKYLVTIILVALSLISIWSLFHSGLPVTHDGQDHVARIANFYQNLAEGNIIPRWAANLNKGYGHPILEFLYPLPSYIASIFHFVGFSLVDSTKIVFGLGMILSLFSMYLWLKQFLGRWPAILGSVLYTYAPYRLVDTYVRGDIGENLAFAFVPLVLYFIYKLYKTKNSHYVVFGVLSLAFLILAHNAISLILMPFILFYGAFLLYLSKDKKYFLINFSILVILGFGLSAFFWIPGILEGKYTLRNFVTKGEYVNRFSSIPALIYGPWSYGATGQFTQQLGIVQWVALLTSPFLVWKYFKNKDKNLWFALSLIIYTILAIFIMLPISNFIWSRIMLLQNFQFPWRFLAITVFATAVLGAFMISVLPRKIGQYLSILLIIFILIISFNHLHPRAYEFKPSSFYSGVFPRTTDTGESSPIWSIRGMEKYPKAHLEVLDGKATVKETKRTSVYHVYSVKVDKTTLFAENTLYFPGWQIKANGKPLNIEFQDIHYRGIMTFRLEPGEYTVLASYSETKLRAISDLITLTSIVAILIFTGFKFVKK